LAKQRQELRSALVTQTEQLKEELFTQKLAVLTAAEDRNKAIEADLQKRLSATQHYEAEMKMAADRMAAETTRQDEIWFKTTSRAQFVEQLNQLNTTNNQQTRHADETFQDERAMKKQRLAHDLREDRLT
jgi:hypothetical protein